MTTQVPPASTSNSLMLPFIHDPDMGIIIAVYVSAPDSTKPHYNDVTMSAMASQTTSFAIVYSTVYSGANQRKHQNSVSLAFVWGTHRWPVNCPHKWLVTRKMFPCDDVIKISRQGAGCKATSCFLLFRVHSKWPMKSRAIYRYLAFKFQSLYQISMFILHVMQPTSLPFPKQSACVHILLLTVGQ